MPKAVFIQFVWSITLALLACFVVVAFGDLLLAALLVALGQKLRLGHLIAGLYPIVLMAGFVLGANHLLLKGNRLQRVIAVYLAVWIGSTLTLIPAIFIIVLAFPFGRQRLAPSPQGELLSLLFLHGFMLILGAAVLWQAREQLFSWAKINGFLASVREVLLPAPGGGPKHYRIELPFNVEELDRRLALMPPIGQRGLARIKLFFSDDEMLVCGSRQGDQVIFSRPAFRGVVTMKTQIKPGLVSLTLDSESQMPLVQKLMIGYMLFCMSLLGFGWLLMAFSQTDPVQRLILAWGSVVIWATLVVIIRVEHLKTRRGEDEIMAFLEQRWGAVIERRPRRRLWPWF
jgi:hypothetical protein